MFREIPGQPYYPMNHQQNPFQNAGQQSVDFYGHLGYPKPDYPVLMQQQYYDNYQYNKMFSSQVFTPHVQPIFIAGPIYKNSPIFYGPQYLSQSLFQPVEKKKSYNYSKPDEVIEQYDSNNLTSRKQIEENIRIRNQLLDQWNFEEQQKLQTQEKEKEKENEKQKRIEKNYPERQRQSQNSLNSSQRSLDKVQVQVQEKKQNQVSFKSLPKIDEEQEKQEKKDNKQQLNAYKKKKRGKRNLRIILQALTFILMYFLRMKNTLLKRKKLQMNKENSSEKVNLALQEGSEWFLAFFEKELLDFWGKKESLNWLESDQISDKEKKNRINKVKQFIEKLTVTLVEQIKHTSFPNNFIAFMAQISQNYQFVPDQYLFNFELVRLEFNSFSAINNIQTPQKKMTLSFLIMIRILAFTILFTPWTLGLSNIKKTQILESNCLIIVSVLQEIVISEFREIPPNENNQNHLSIDVKVNSRPQGPLKVLPDPKTQQEKLQLKNSLEPLIYPTYKREEMKDLFENQIQWVEQIMDSLDEVYSKIVRIVNTWHQQNKIKITDGLKRKK